MRRKSGRSLTSNRRPYLHTHYIVSDERQGSARARALRPGELHRFTTYHCTPEGKRPFLAHKESPTTNQEMNGVDTSRSAR